MPYKFIYFWHIRMKKITLLLLLVGIATLGFTQNPFFQAGFQFGGNFSQVDGDHLSGYNKIGAMAGVSISHQLNSDFHFGIEINYMQKGSKRRLDPEDPNPQIFILRFDYIELPLLLRMQKGPWNYTAGWTIGNNVRAQRDEGFGFVDAQIKSWENGLLFGASYEVDDHFALMIRHSASVFRVGDDYPNRLNIFNRIGLYNRLFTLGVQYTR
jgi:hypothetical protein